jgi:beta-glucosidase
MTLVMLIVSVPGTAQGQPQGRPWLDPALDADTRTRLLLEAMTREEKLTLVFGYYSSDAPWKNFKKPKEAPDQAAGYVAGVPRLGIPALTETDAGIGVASQPGPNPRLRTALPANIAVAASWDPDLAYDGGRMIGDEARLSGFNVMLAGGINLAREPRNGRNFEYGGEDPWLAASMVAAQIRGIQSNHLISSIKHFALNDQETQRGTLSAHIDPAAARMSDLLAFELAIAQAGPGAVMCGYNRINEVYSCENEWLLNEVLKGDWAYKGFVMSDWGATHSTVAAVRAGLDQESGYPFDASPYFADALKEAVEDGHVAASRLDDMVGRVLRSMFVNGLFDYPIDPSAASKIDFGTHAMVTQAAAEGGMVLLRNEHALLPLGNSVKSILIVGSHADVGVLSGGGSSQVYAPGGPAFIDSHIQHGPLVYLPSSPLESLAGLTGAHLSYDDGADVSGAVRRARRADVVIVFAHQWSAEGVDGTLRLDGDQDALIAAIGKANTRTAVVLETGGPVLMPWIGKVAAVLEAWYPGSSGGAAIARILTGKVDPSGRLPMTFPRSLQQVPRPGLDGIPLQPKARVSVDYTIEGAAVGYKWFDRKELEPLFPFGYGLSYGRFQLSDLSANLVGPSLSVRFAVANTGSRAGKYVGQIYVGPRSDWEGQGWEAPQRLAGFAKASLHPGARTAVRLSIDPRMLAVYDDRARSWLIREGEYDVFLSIDSRHAVEHVSVHLARQVLKLE